MKRTASTLLLAATLAVAPACSEDAAEAGTGTAPNVSASPPSVASLNDSIISLKGKVIASQPSGFMLDYGAGRMMVEMDDWDWYQEGRVIKAGDEVVVTGRVDRDVLEQAKLEASSVYVANLGTYFYASAADEEDTGLGTRLLMPAGLSDAVGNVTRVEGREFTLGHEGSSLRVDTSQMADNPLDDQGSLQIRVGDRVYVSGRLDIEPAESGELMAQRVVAMRPDRKKGQAAPATPKEEQGS